MDQGPEFGSERLIRNMALAQRVRDTFFDQVDINTINENPDATYEIILRGSEPQTEYQLLYVRDTNTPGFKEWREDVPYPIRGDVMIINETSEENKYETVHGALKGYLADKNGDTYAVIPNYMLSMEGQACVRTEIREVDIGFNEPPDIDFKLEEGFEMRNFEEQDYIFIEKFLQDFKDEKIKEEPEPGKK